ncbi:MAG: hypothetical protein DRP59_03840, partial [Spirochaetes bacterium]
HSQISEEDQAKGGFSHDMVRLSVGFEDAADIIDDMEQAL